MKKILLLLLAAAVLVSCKKNDEITVILKQSGQLKITLLNGTTPISDTKISISYFSPVLEEVETDENGVADFGELNVGFYTLEFEDVVVEGTEYNPVRAVQVIGGTTKEYEINVLDYVGQITVNVTEDHDDWLEDDYPAANVSVAIVEQDDIDFSNIDETIDDAIMTGTTNSDGEYVFTNVPSGFSYYVFAYLTVSDEIVDYDFTSLYLDKQQEEEKNILVNYIAEP